MFTKPLEEWTLEELEEVIQPWTATYLCVAEKFTGNAGIYEMSPPHGGYEKVIVSAIATEHAHETFIFGILPDGEVDWDELPGSVRDTTSHVQVLSSVGYVVK